MVDKYKSRSFGIKIIILIIAKFYSSEWKVNIILCYEMRSYDYSKLVTIAFNKDFLYAELTAFFYKLVNL